MKTSWWLPSALVLGFLALASGSVPSAFGQASAPPDNQTKFTSPPGEETVQAKELIERAGAALQSGKSVTDLLTDPAFLSVHEYPRFRKLIRQSAQSSRTTIVTPKEPGEPLVAVGRVVNRDGEPIKGALVYVYHTSAKGWYSDRAAHVAAVAGDAKHARLFGYMKTNASGRFEVHTIRPVGYPDTDLPAHIHVEIEWTDTEPRSIATEIQFDDDPRLTPEWRRRSQQEGFRIGQVHKDPDRLQRVEVEFRMP